MTESVVVFNPSAIWSIPGVNIDEARGDSTAIIAMTATFIIFLV